MTSKNTEPDATNKGAESDQGGISRTADVPTADDSSSVGPKAKSTIEPDSTGKGVASTSPAQLPARHGRTSLLGRGAVGTGIAAVLFGYAAWVLDTPITSGQGTAIGGAAVLAGAALTYFSAYQNRKSAEKTADQQLAIAREEVDTTQAELQQAKADAIRQQANLDRAFTDQQATQGEATGREIRRDLRARFTSAAEQLGSTGLATRMAGVYALAALADDWFAFGVPDERQVCIDLLCAYVRRPKDVVETVSSDDGQVRATIIAVIAERTRLPVDAKDGPWQGCRFDFSNARLPAMNLQNCRFIGELNFSQADFDGVLNLSGSVLDFARFDRATFKGGVFFTSAHFGNRVDMKDAIFSTSANFKLARFNGHTDLSYAEVDHTALDFRGAFFNLGSTTLFAHIDLRTDSVIDFSFAWFKGGEVDLRGAQVQLGAVIRFLAPRKWVREPQGDWVNEASPEYLDPATWPPPQASQPEGT